MNFHKNARLTLIRRVEMIEDVLHHRPLVCQTGTKLHADDTPIPVLVPGNGKTKTARLWAYVRDNSASGDTTPAAVWFAYTPDRKGIHP